MTIHDFGKYVEQKILDRGHKYYRYDKIELLDQFEVGEFNAVVLGSEEYNVFVKLDKDQKIIASHCDCPYDWGDVCKHEVAVYYYIRDDESYKQHLSKEAVDLMHKIDQMTPSELKTCLHEILKRDREWRAAFQNNEI